jgi:hypothetical protein
MKEIIWIDVVPKALFGVAHAATGPCVRAIVIQVAHASVISERISAIVVCGAEIEALIE